MTASRPSSEEVWDCVSGEQVTRAKTQQQQPRNAMNANLITEHLQYSNEPPRARIPNTQAAQEASRLAYEPRQALARHVPARSAPLQLP